MTRKFVLLLLLTFLFAWSYVQKVTGLQVSYRAITANWGQIEGCA